MRPGRAWSLVVVVAFCLVLLAQGVTEEVPLGGVQGLVTMSENGRPLAGATVMLTPVLNAEYVRIRSATTKADGSFTIRNMPAGEYQMQAYAKAHSLADTLVTIAEGKPTTLQVDLQPHEPHIDLYTSQRVFTPNEQAQFEAHGFIEPDALHVEVFSLDSDWVARKGGISSAINAIAYPGQNQPDPLASMGTRVAAYAHKITRRDGEGVFVEHVKMNKLPEGLYFVRCSAGAAHSATFLNITRLSLVVKTAPGEALCFASDILTGAPVAGVLVRQIAPGGSGASGTTNANGIARLVLPKSPESQAFLAVHGTSRAVVGTYNYGSEDSSLRTFVYTDRPIYRPGDTVQFKGVVRRLAGSEYALLPPTQATIDLYNTSGGFMNTLTVPVDAHGTFHGSVPINAESAPGALKLEVKIGGASDNHYVTVSAYRKPTFSVSVEPEKPFYIRGDRAQVRVKCTYFHGGPVAGAKVSGSIYRAPYWDYAPIDQDEADDSESGYSGSGENAGDVDVTTDARGEAIVSFETRRPQDASPYDTDDMYTVSAYVEDPGGEYFDGSGEVKVVRGTFALGVDCGRYVLATGESVEATIVAHDHTPQQAGVANLPLRVLVGHELYEHGDVRFVEDSRHSLTTGANGRATFVFAPTRAGSTVLRVLGTDTRGTEISASQYVWVDGEAATDARPRPAGNVTLTLDKRTYRVGDTAKVLLRTSEPGGSALLTVEGDRVYDARVVPLPHGSAVVSLPVAQLYAPNAFVTVAYVRNKRFMDASRRLSVAAPARELTIKVAADRAVVGPGDSVTYTINTTDDRGRPARADLSLGVVDEAIYAIAEDDTDIAGDFYPRRSNGVSTAYSFPEVYLDGGDKAPKDLKVRTRFLDTAYWNPNVQTDATGTAIVTVALPDNITQWRATVVGATDGTAVGMASTKIRARKPLMVRLAGPAFMVRGDQRTLSAVVTNDTGADASVHVGIDGGSLPLDGPVSQTFDVKQGEQQTVSWLASASRTGEAKVVVKAWIDGGASDGMQLRVPVRALGRIVDDLDAGTVDGSAELALVRRPGADANTGRVVLTLSPTLAGTLLAGLDGLIEYPYGCVEQTMSRFLPAVVVVGVARQLGLPLPARANQVPQIAADSLARLETMQLQGGGWGWWEYDDPDPGMTALVLEGLARARDAGYPNHLAKRGVEWVKSSVLSKEFKWTAGQRLALLRALTLHGEGAFVAGNLPNVLPGDTSPLECACAVQIAHALGDQALEQRMVDRLVSLARDRGTFATWREDGYGHETTARAFEALAEARPGHPLLPKIARGLLAERQGDGWDSTRDTASILLALARYLPTTGELAAKGAAEVRLNGALLHTVPLDPGAAHPDARIEIPLSALREGRNTLKIARRGGGRLYYTLDSRQTVAFPTLGEVVNGSGLRVERRYYLLESRRMEDGTLRLVPSQRPVSRVRKGQTVHVELILRSSEAREYVLIEDPIPSGFHVVDRGWVERWDWHDWYAHRDVYDDRVAFFARAVDSGNTTLTYTMQAENVGQGLALPTRAYEMYAPARNGSSGTTPIEVIR